MEKKISEQLLSCLFLKLSYTFLGNHRTVPGWPLSKFVDKRSIRNHPGLTLVDERAESRYRTVISSELARRARGALADDLLHEA